MVKISMQLENSSVLQNGKYKIVRFIGAGGFGCTYEAHHTLLDMRVALKEFFVSDFCNRDEKTGQVTVGTQSKVELYGKLKKKFLDEARALFKMKHSGIVRVIDVFEENGTAYYAMEYIDGQSLSDLVKKRGKLPEAEAVGYILQIADALKYVHSLNRLHLDIKPGNIMLNKEGKAILIDFGASKHYDDETGENTSTLLGINTKGYAPVEQVNQSFKSFSPATDIYALGATLYKLLTGITPPPSTLLHSEETTLTPLPSSISTSTRKAVETAMQLLRKNRPQSVAKWVATLIDDEETNVNIVMPEPSPSPQPHPNPLPLKRYLMIAVVAVAVLVGTVGYLKGVDGSKAVKDYPAMANDGSVIYKWTGELTNQNLPTGKGVATFTAGDKQGRKEYHGEMNNGQCESTKATMYYTNGSTFEGSFKNGMRAEGTMTITQDEMYYKGTYLNDKEYNGKWYFLGSNELYSEVINGKETVK